MKKIGSAILLMAVIAIMGCTNKEGGSDLDIITPNDSTEGKMQAQELHLE